MLQSNKRYEERNIKRIPKKVGVKVMEIKSLLIKDTTREERKQIVEESFGNISASCDGCMAGLAEMYQEYIDGTKEIRDINMEFNNRSKNSLTSIGDGMNCTFEHVCSNS